jgi:hypothetical protein
MKSKCNVLVYMSFKQLKNVLTLNSRSDGNGCIKASCNYNIFEWPNDCCIKIAILLFIYKLYVVWQIKLFL